jgi:hypothetical protein
MSASIVSAVFSISVEGSPAFDSTGIFLNLLFKLSRPAQ